MNSLSTVVMYGKIGYKGQNPFIYIMFFHVYVSGMLTELDTVMGPLSLASSMSAMVRYTRQGVYWLRLGSQKVKWPTILLLLLDVCKPFQLPLAPGLSLRLCTSRLFLDFTRTLNSSHEKGRLISSRACLQGYHTDHCTCLFIFFFSHVHIGVSVCLSGTFMNFGYICCNPHISCFAPALYLPVPRVGWYHGVTCESSLDGNIK